MTPLNAAQQLTAPWFKAAALNRYPANPAGREGTPPRIHRNRHDDGVDANGKPKSISRGTARRRMARKLWAKVAELRAEAKEKVRLGTATGAERRFAFDMVR